MPFLEERLNTNIGYPSGHGRAYDVQITETLVNSYAVRRHPYVLARFSLLFGNKAIETQLAGVVDLFDRCGGMAGGVRMKNKQEFTTNNYLDAPTYQDQQCTEISAGAGTYQLTRWYGTPSTTCPRRIIKKPVAGTVLVGIQDGMTITPTTAFTVDTTTGIITMDAPLDPGQILWAGCEFDLPVRFGTDLTGMALGEGRVLSSTIEFIELRNPEAIE